MGVPIASAHSGPTLVILIQVRIPFPERIQLWYVAAFAGLLFIVQTLQHTDPVVSMSCFAFILIAGIAFNVAGGLTRPSGAYVFFFATLAVILGLVVKALSWEPADSNLVDARLTFELFLLGMFAMLAATYFSRRFAARQGLLERMMGASDLRMATIGCTIAGILIPYLAGLYQETDTETVFTPLAHASSQLNRFLPMAIILGTTYEIRRSGGRSSLNLWAVIAAGYIFLDGVLINYSKEGLFLPVVCWLVAGAALGYRYRGAQIVGGALFVMFLVHYMVPYCQYGRIYRSSTAPYSEKFANSLTLLADLPGVVRLYDASVLIAPDEHPTAAYFNQTHGGLIDRLQMISWDDALHQVTLQKGPLGFGAVFLYIENAVPHFIWKNKPWISSANFYGHEIGVLGEDDDETAISFSPVGEAFRLEGWAGIFVLAPIVWFVLFFVTDSLCGDVRRSPWGILSIASFAHAAPEGGMGACFYLLTYGTFVIAFVAFFSAYVLPLIASLVSPPTRVALQPFRSAGPLNQAPALAPASTTPEANL